MQKQSILLQLLYFYCSSVFLTHSYWVYSAPNDWNPLYHCLFDLQTRSQRMFFSSMSFDLCVHCMYVSRSERGLHCAADLSHAGGSWDGRKEVRSPGNYSHTDKLLHLGDKPYHQSASSSSQWSQAWVNINVALRQMQSIKKSLNDKLLNLEETGSVVTTVRGVLKANIGMSWQDLSTRCTGEKSGKSYFPFLFFILS